MQLRSRPRSAATSGVRQLQKTQTREALLAAARTVIAREGFGRATTRKIAAEAGVSSGTLFVHFADVGALAEALLDTHLGRALDKAYQTLPKQGDVIDRLVHVSKQLFESYDADPELSKQYLAASLFRADPAGPAAQRLAQFERWVVSELAGAGLFQKSPLGPQLAFSAFFSLYFGALVSGLRGMVNRRRQVEWLETSLRVFFGLGKAP